MVCYRHIATYPDAHPAPTALFPRQLAPFPNETFEIFSLQVSPAERQTPVECGYRPRHEANDTSEINYMAEGEHEFNNVYISIPENTGRQLAH